MNTVLGLFVVAPTMFLSCMYQTPGPVPSIVSELDLLPVICDIYSGSIRPSSNEFPRKIISGLAMFSSSIRDRSNSSGVCERPRSAGITNTTIIIAANSTTDRGVTLSVPVFPFVVRLM